jgi:O-antigen/teichoic acid export membrane protein
MTEASTLTGQAVKGSFYTLVASLATLCLGFTRSMLLARLLLPEHFGVVGLALFFIGLVGQAKGLGLDAALLHRNEADEPFLRTYFSLRTGLDVAAFGLLLVLTPLLQTAYPAMVGLGRVLPLLTGAYLLSSLSQVQETLLSKHLAFSRLAITDVAASLVMTIVAVYLAWKGWGMWALVAERVSGLGTRFLLTWGVFRRWSPRLGWDRQIARWLWDFGRPLWMAGNVSYLLDQFDDFWVGTTLGKTSLGFYGKSYEFALYPRRVIGNPLVTVMLPLFARIYKDRPLLSRLFHRSMYILLRLGVLVAGAFALLLPEFIHLVIGDKWLPMLWTFRLMLIYTTLDAPVMLASNLLLASGRPQALRQASLAQAAFFVPAVIAGAQWIGINGVALAADGMLLIGAWRLYRALGEVVDLSLRSLLLWPLCALALAWGAGMALESQSQLALGLAAALKLGTFAILYAGILLLAEREEVVHGLRWLWGALRTRFGIGRAL